jgi:hypothetical protein
MNVILVILLVLAMLATVGALVRGIAIFLMQSREDIGRGGPSVSGLRQNKMMQARILFQALAIIIVILLLVLGHGGRGS